MIKNRDKMNKLAKTTRKWYKFTCSSVPGIVSSHYIDLRSSSQGDILIALGFPGTNLEKHWRTALTRRDEANWNLESNLVCVASDTVSMPREHISSSLSLQDPRRIYMCILLSLSDTRVFEPGQRGMYSQSAWATYDSRWQLLRYAAREEPYAHA